MLSYILQVSLCWAACYLLYHLLLRSETFFRLNRWYLLGTALLSLAIPVAELPFFAEAAGTVPAVGYLQPITVGVQELETILITASAEEQGFDFWQMLTWLYAAGVVVSLGRFGYGLFQIFRLRRNGEVTLAQGYRFVRTPEAHVPFSFFKNLFWSEKFVVDEAERRAILRHEEAHIFQWHSLDVLLLELLGIVFWCSPPVYFYKKAVKTTHEYLADEQALHGANRRDYGHLLLRQVQPDLQVAISNSLFSSQIKNRIVMMTKNKSSKRATWKYLAGLPVLALLLLAFSNGEMSDLTEQGLTPPTEVALDTLPTGGEMVFEKPEEMPRFPGCEDVADAEQRNLCAQKKMFEFIFSNLKYPKEAKEAGIEGMVVVNFIVEADGSIADAEIKRGIGGGCDEEVLRMAYLMPKWVPGQQDGKAVRVSFNLPVRFKLDPADVAKQKQEVDEMPHYVAGCEDLTGDEQLACSQQQLVNFIIENLEYPAAAKSAGVEGMAVVSFTVAADGSVQNPTIAKSLDPSCDAEVLRVVKLMPNWKPGMVDGKAVPVEMKLPFKFALSKTEGAAKPEVEPSSSVEYFEVYPNPSGENGFTVKFKAAAGPVKFVVTDISGKQLTSIPVDNYDGSVQTARVDGLFGEKAPRANVVVTMLDSKGNVLKSTTVMMQ